MSEKKVPRKYNTIQNIWFMIKLAWNSKEKKVLVIGSLISLLTVIQNLLNLYVSPVILGAVEDHVSVQNLLFIIAVFVLTLMVVSAALTYVNFRRRGPKDRHCPGTV